MSTAIALIGVVVAGLNLLGDQSGRLFHVEVCRDAKPAHYDMLTKSKKMTGAEFLRKFLLSKFTVEAVRHLIRLLPRIPFAAM